MRRRVAQVGEVCITSYERAERVRVVEVGAVREASVRPNLHALALVTQYVEQHWHGSSLILNILRSFYAIIGEYNTVNGITGETICSRS